MMAGALMPGPQKSSLDIRQTSSTAATSGKGNVYPCWVTIGCEHEGAVQRSSGSVRQL